MTKSQYTREQLEAMGAKLPPKLNLSTFPTMPEDLLLNQLATADADVDTVMQAIGAGISRRDWSEVERNFGMLRDRIVPHIQNRIVSEKDALNRFQDQVWGAFQTWSMALGWGLTGIQPECYAAMDASIDRMLTAEDRLREAVEVMEPFAKAGAIKLCGEWKDHEYIWRTDVGFYLNFGDIRRARDFLAKLEATDADQ